MNKPVPYIGITGFTDCAQVQKMLNIFNWSPGIEDNRNLHVGVMMGHKTLHGIPTKLGWENIFPKNEDVHSIFFKHEHLFNVLHFADYEQRSGVEILHDLRLATNYGGFDMEGLQLDMVWPDPNAILAYKESYPKIKIIIQVNPDALKAIAHDPTALVARLSQYEDSIDYVLLDKSVGRGLSMNAQELMPFIHAITDGPYADRLRAGKGPVGVVVAGGLGPETLHLVECLVAQYPDLSIDAQGKLCPSGTSLDHIDLELAGQYLKRAIYELFYPQKLP